MSLQCFREARPIGWERVRSVSGWLGRALWTVSAWATLFFAGVCFRAHNVIPGWELDDVRRDAPILWVGALCSIILLDRVLERAGMWKR